MARRKMKNKIKRRKHLVFSSAQKDNRVAVEGRRQIQLLAARRGALLECSAVRADAATWRKAHVGCAVTSYCHRAAESCAFFVCL